MAVVNIKEFASHQKKYFDLAEKEDICIKRGQSMFHLIYKPVEKQYSEQPILEPDDDLRRAITAEELLERIHVDIRKKFASRL